MIAYDAASGQGPGAQCWGYSASGSGPTPMGGLLDFGSSGVGGTRFFDRTDNAVLFTGRLTVSARVQVVSGAYNGNPCGAGQRAGVGFGWSDAQGRHLTVGLGTDRVYISTENNAFSGPNNPSAAYAWGGVMRDVRLEIDNLTFTLFIDGQNVVSVSRPGMPTGQGTPNRAYFGGDLSVCVGGHGVFERFGITAVALGTGDISIGSQPGATVMACAGSPLVLSASATSPWPQNYQWRRNGVAIVDGALSGGATASGATTQTLTIDGYHGELDGSYDLLIVNPCGSRTTTPAAVLLPVQCGPADLGRAGGFPCPDGLLDNNDFIAFINYFFEQNFTADMGGAGGFPTPDEAFDNNDFIAFINYFFDGC